MESTIEPKHRDRKILTANKVKKNDVSCPKAPACDKGCCKKTASKRSMPMVNLIKEGPVQCKKYCPSCSTDATQNASKPTNVKKQCSRSDEKSNPRLLKTEHSKVGSKLQIVAEVIAAVRKKKSKKGKKRKSLQKLESTSHETKPKKERSLQAKSVAKNDPHALPSQQKCSKVSDNYKCQRKEQITTAHEQSQIQTLKQSSIVNLENLGNDIKPVIAPFMQLVNDVEMSDVSCQSLNGIENVEAGSHKKCFIVLDTNILISELKFVDDILDVPFEDFGLPHIYIPWVVLQELDSLKRNIQRQPQAIKAVSYLHKKLLSKHPRFHGQSTKLASECHDLNRSRCNDDDVLNCCLQLQEKVPKDEVILLTNDKNLCNKGLISGVKTHTVLSFKALINNNNTSKSVSVVVIKGNSTSKPKSETRDTHSVQNQHLDLLKNNIKIILRDVLEPFLSEALLYTFGDIGKKFLPPSTCSLLDILQYFKKYWTPVFDSALSKTFLDYLQKFEVLCIDNANHDPVFVLSVLTFAEAACREVLAVTKTCQSNAETALHLVLPLITQYQTLKEQTTPRGQVGDPAMQESKQIVLEVFHHIWSLINHLCGMIMDFLKMPHNFVYDRPTSCPAKKDFLELIFRLYPGVHKIKRAFEKILQNVDPSRLDVEVQHLHRYLIQFIPSLKIQATNLPPGQFTEEHLKHFCLDHHNRELMQNGYTQLLNFYETLEKCLRDPVWKQ